MELAQIFEIIGAFIGLTYLYLEYHVSFWLWIAGIIMSLFYIIIFFYSKFYADSLVYLYYLGANIYGLVLWKKYRKKDTAGVQDLLPITHLPRKLYAPLSGLMVLLFFLLFFLLSTFTDSPVPVGDSFTTALSVIAMYMLAKKYIEHWLLWIVVNFVSAALYVWKGLIPTAILFAIYGVVSIFAFYNWKKNLC